MMQYKMAYAGVMDELSRSQVRGDDETEYLIGMVTGITIVASHDKDLDHASWIDCCEKDAQIRNAIYLAREERELKEAK